MPSVRSVLVSVLASLLLGLDCHAVPLHESVAHTVLETRNSAPHSPPTSLYKTRFPDVTWDNAAWQLRTTHLDQRHYQSRMSIANGYLGINVAALGPFYDFDLPVGGTNVNGWPIRGSRQTFATISGFYDSEPKLKDTNFAWLNQYGGESVISGVPHWGGLVVDLGNGEYIDATTDSATISDFSSTLDVKAGLTLWEFTWTPVKAGLSFKVSYALFTHKLYINQAFVQLRIEPSKDYEVSIVNVFNGDCAVRTNLVEKGIDKDGQLYAAVKPLGISDVTAHLYAAVDGSSELDLSSAALVTDKPYLGGNHSSIAQGYTAKLKAGSTTVVTKYVGGATTDGFTDPRSQAKQESLRGLSIGYEKSLASHIAEWESVLPDASVDHYTYPENGTLPDNSYVVESALTAVTTEYYLLQNTISENALAHLHFPPIDGNSISVGGLTSDSYGGLIFWDAEVWMHPGLALSHPQAARQIVKYRVDRYGQAKKNAQTAYQSSKNTTKFSDDAAVYSWTSGRFGNCTGTGPCFDYQYHINGDILQSFVNYWAASGDTEFFKTYLFPIYNSIATFYSELLIKNGSTYVLTNMTDPDEYANAVDGGGFTSPLIVDSLLSANQFRAFFGLPTNEKWDTQAKNMFIPRDGNAGIILEYVGQNGSAVVKQADVVLDTFPLNFQQNYTAQDSRNDLEYYAGKQSPNGPAMTWAIYSIVNSAVALSGCAAFTYQQYAEAPYARAPWFFFSEQAVDIPSINGGTNPAYPFLTGHGGSNQVSLFGYLGLRLNVDFVLHINPDLPPQIPHLRYRVFYWQGWPISAASNRTHTTVTRLSVPYDTANLTYATHAIPVQVGEKENIKKYSLPPKGTITVSNRLISDQFTTKGDIAQCLPVTSPDEYEPGQFPISAVDGSVTTKWQPTVANRTTSITIDLGTQPVQQVSSFFFDFGLTPPTKVSVLFHNTTSIATAVTVASQPIKITLPYNETEYNIIHPYTSNTTTITLNPPVYSARYATLQIQGNANDNLSNATGATVASWAIIGAEGQHLEPRMTPESAWDLVKRLWSA